MLQVLISYKSEYRSFATALRDQIRAWGYSTWIDIDDIRQGTYFRHEIQRGLESSDVVVGVLTPEALESREVMWEWDYALAHSRLIPVRYRDVPLPYHLQGIQYVDFITNPSDGYEQLAEALRRTAPFEPPPHSLSRSVAAENITSAQVGNRQAMIERVRQSWIDGFLRSVLHSGRSIPIDFSLAPQAVLRHVDFGDHRLSPYGEITDVFDDMNRELLILGEPGSGKTVLLLKLAQTLLDRAEADPTQPIPGVFNLSSWGLDQPPFAEWLIAELGTGYQVPRNIAAHWLEHEQLLLLLDGLDEVAEAQRDSLVTEINAFRQQYRYVDLAVCSRIADYKALTGRLDLRGAVLLEQLQPAQIEQYISVDGLAGLRQTMIQDAHLRAMSKNPFMLNAMALAYEGQTPASLVMPTDESTLADRQRKLLETYIERRLQRLAFGDNPDGVTPRQVRHYLEYLAGRMVAHNQTIFYIESMQPTWLLGPSQRRAYDRLVNLPFLAISFITSILLALMSYYTVRSTYSPEQFLLYTIVFSVSGIFSYLLSYNLTLMLQRWFSLRISFLIGAPFSIFASGLLALALSWLGILILSVKPWEGMGLSDFLRLLYIGTWIEAVQVEDMQTRQIMVDLIMKILIVAAAIVGFFVATVATWSVFVGSHVAGQRNQIEMHSWSWHRIKTRFNTLIPGKKITYRRLYIRIAIVYSFGALAWMWFVASTEYPMSHIGFLLLPFPLVVYSLLSIGISRGLVGDTLELRRTPGGSMRHSAQVAGAAFIIAVLSVAVCAGLADLSNGVSFFHGFLIWLAMGGLMFGVPTLLTYGGLGVVQYAALRSVLQRDDYVPANYRAFLDYAAQSLLLRKVGSGYTFAHRYLLEHFAVSTGADLEKLK